MLLRSCQCGRWESQHWEQTLRSELNLESGAEKVHRRTESWVHAWGLCGDGDREEGEATKPGGQEGEDCLPDPLTTWGWRVSSASWS